MYKVIHTLEVSEVCVSPRVDRMISRTFGFDGLFDKGPHCSSEWILSGAGE